MSERKPAEKTDRFSTRFTPETAAQLATLARFWGGVVRPLTRAAAVDEAIRRCYEAVMGPAGDEERAADAEPEPDVVEGARRPRPEPRKRPRGRRKK